MNSAYRSIFISNISVAINGAMAASTVTHPGVLGTIREILIRNLFRPLLPADIGIGTGQIVTFDNDFHHSKMLLFTIVKFCHPSYTKIF